MADIPVKSMTTNDNKPQTNNKGALAPGSDKNEATEKPRRSVLKEFDPFISDSPCLPKKTTTSIKRNEALPLLISGWQDPVRHGRISPNVGDTSDIEYEEAFESLSSQPENPPKSIASEEKVILPSEKANHVEEKIERPLNTDEWNKVLESSLEEDISIKIPELKLSDNTLKSELQIQEDIPEIHKIIEDPVNIHPLQVNQNADKRPINDQIFQSSQENELEKQENDLEKCPAHHRNLKEPQTTSVGDTTLNIAFDTISSALEKLNMNDLNNKEESTNETCFQDPKDSDALDNSLGTEDYLGNIEVETKIVSRKSVIFSTEDVEDSLSEDKNEDVVQSNSTNNESHTPALEKTYNTDKTFSSASEDLELADFEATEKALDKKSQLTTELKTVNTLDKKELNSTQENLFNSSEDLELAEFETAEKVLNTDFQEKISKVIPNENEKEKEVGNITFNSEDMQQSSPQNTKNDNTISNSFNKPNETISVENDEGLTSMARSFSKTIDLEESAIVEASDNSKSDTSNDSKDTLNQTVNKTLEFSGSELESAINVTKANSKPLDETKTVVVEYPLHETIQVNNETNNLETQLEEIVSETKQTIELNEVTELNKSSEVTTTTNILSTAENQINIEEKDINVSLNKGIITEKSNTIHENCLNQEEVVEKTGIQNNDTYFKDVSASVNVLNSSNSMNTEAHLIKHNLESPKAIVLIESHVRKSLNSASSLNGSVPQDTQCAFNNIESPLTALNQTHTRESLNAAQNNDSPQTTNYLNSTQDQDSPSPITLKIENPQTKNYLNSTQDQDSPILKLDQTNTKTALNTTHSIKRGSKDLNQTVDVESVESSGKVLNDTSARKSLNSVLQRKSAIVNLNQTHNLECKYNESSELAKTDAHTRTSLNAIQTFESPLRNLNQTHAVDYCEKVDTPIHSETYLNETQNVCDNNGTLESARTALSETHNMEFLKLNARKSYRESLNNTSSVDSPKLKITKTVQENEVMIDSLEGPILEKKESLDNVQESKDEKQDTDSEKIMTDSLEGPVILNGTLALKSTSPCKSSCIISLKEILTSSTQNFIQIETKNQNGVRDLNNKTDKIIKDVISEESNQNVLVVDDPELVKKAEHLEHELQATKKNCVQNMQVAVKYRSDIQKYQVVLAEYEQQIAKQDRELEKIKQENDMMGKHFSNLELAFSDVFQKYEKAKQTVEKYRQNEDNLTKTVLSMEEAVKRCDARYQQAKNFLEQEVNNMNKQVIDTQLRYDSEIASLKTKQKRYEIKCLSLETALKQKTEECQQLAALCDDITGQGE